MTQKVMHDITDLYVDISSTKTLVNALEKSDMENAASTELLRGIGLILKEMKIKAEKILDEMDTAD